MNGFGSSSIFSLMFSLTKGKKTKIKNKKKIGEDSNPL
jgi:hypothetical protein